MRAATTATGSRGVVSSGASQASDAGAAVLAGGGTAADAAVAASAVLCVCLPHATGLGGDMFALVRRPDGVIRAVNASGTAPRHVDGVDAITATTRDTDVFRFGPLAATVPGTVRGWIDVLGAAGSLGLEALLADAIEYAASGVEITAGVANAVRRMAPTLSRDPGCADLFLPGGRPVAAGETLRQPALAGTLTRLAEGGWREFYEGETAAALSASVARSGGVLDIADLAGYESIVGAPVTSTYRGREVVVPGPNSYAQLLLLQLAALETEPSEALAANDDARLERLMRARHAAFAAGLDAIGTTDPADAAVGQRALSALIDRAQSVYRADTGDPTTAGRLARGGTTTVACADRDGTVVVIVQSLFRLFGANVRCPDTGILLNDRMFGFATAADTSHIGGTRPPHTLSPSMVRDGEAVVAIASPGSIGQTVTLTQVVSNWIDGGLTLAEAVQMPRWNLQVTTLEPLLEANDGPVPPGVTAVRYGTDGSHGAVTIARWDGADGASAVADGRRGVAARSA
ncbi:MAG TPA: gamma-glutamyltransferase [Micromonosporaceae bacterium]|jgi:gamma-glutamyltranspeptidase/glutathione hydrolase